MEMKIMKLTMKRIIFMGFGQRVDFKSTLQNLSINLLKFMLLVLKSYICFIPSIHPEDATICEIISNLGAVCKFIGCIVKDLMRYQTCDEYWRFYYDQMQADFEKNGNHIKMSIFFKKANRLTDLVVNYSCMACIILVIVFHVVPVSIGVGHRLLGNKDYYIEPHQIAYIDYNITKNLIIILIIDLTGGFASISSYINNSLLINCSIYCKTAFNNVGAMIDDLSEYNERMNKEEALKPELSGNIPDSLNDEYMFCEYSENRKSIELSMLYEIVKQHQRAIKMTESFTDLFGTQYAFDSATVALFSCFCFLTVTLTDSHLEKCNYILLAFLNYFDYFWPNYFGQEIINSSLEIADKINNLPWYEYPISHQRIVSIIMQRSQHQVQLTGLYFYGASNETFAKITRAGFTFFTMLQTFTM